MANRTFSANRTTASREETIARRAYELWEQAGRPQGQSAAHWYQAEAELAPPVREPARTEPATARPPRRTEISTPRTALRSR